MSTSEELRNVFYKGAKWNRFFRESYNGLLWVSHIYAESRSWWNSIWLRLLLLIFLFKNLEK